MKSGIGQATGKIVLMGEHAVVYGKKAVALPFFSVGIKTTINDIEGPIRIESACYTGLLKDAQKAIPGLKYLIEKTLEHLNIPTKNLEIMIDSSIPAQRGLGSSASVSVSVVRSLFNKYDQELDNKTLSDLVFLAETIHHNNPSGLDATVIIEESFISFEKDKGLKHIDSNLKGYLIVADTGMFGNTKESVSNVQERLKREPEKTKEAIDNLGKLSEEAIHDIESGNLEHLGKLMTSAHDKLKNIGVSNETLDRLVTSALKNNALGAKLTGGGNGGCMIAITDTMVDAKNIVDALLEQGAKHTWIYHLKEL